MPTPRAAAARTLRFRHEYRDNHPGRYSGKLHAAWIAGCSTALIGLCILQIVPGGWHWVMAPIAFVVANFGEWWLHKHTMHWRFEPLKTLWHRHTIEHHNFFTETHMAVDSTRDLRIVLLPPIAILGVALLHGLIGIALGALLGAQAGWAWLLGGITHYLVYEMLHLASHLPNYRWFASLPILSTVRRNHWIHHHQSLMPDYNLNLTVPLADWALDTTDLQRNFWGVLFNRYRMDYLKPEVQQRIPERSFGGDAPPTHTPHSG